MTKLVNLLKINFVLIIVGFFLPFFPNFFCEKHSETVTTDSTASVIEGAPSSTTTYVFSDTIGLNGNTQDSIVRPDAITTKLAGELKIDSSSSQKSLVSNILTFVLFSEYSSIKGNGSITGIGCIYMSVISIQEGRFDIADWGIYLLPIAFMLSILGLVFSVKSKKRKQQFIFLLSVAGFISISLVGFSVGILEFILFGYWIVAILYLINSLLSFILWKNFK